jgi:hypothetical protein
VRAVSEKKEEKAKILKSFFLKKFPAQQKKVSRFTVLTEVQRFYALL